MRRNYKNVLDSESSVCCCHLAEEGGPLLSLFGQKGVELLDLNQSLCEDQHLLWLLQIMHSHLQCCQTGVPQVQFIPNALRTDKKGKT